MEKLPIACTLSSSELRERQKTSIAGLIEKITNVADLENGYRLFFENEDGIVEMLREFVAFERQCCAFMAYEMDVLKKERAVVLSLTGPEGTKAFIEEMFLQEFRA